MFYGEHEHTIDDKKRLILPSKFRAPLAGGVVLAKGFEPSIDVYPLEAWNANVARVADLDSFSPEARRMKRYVFAGALVTELDAQGRVLLPQQLVQHAELGGTSSSPECTTTSRSGTERSGRLNAARPKGA